MLEQSSQLEISRCPHCQVDTPSIHSKTGFNTKDYKGQIERSWMVYVCQRCGGAILTWSIPGVNIVQEMFPSSTIVDKAIPDYAYTYLQQAIDSLHAPAGSIMLSASAVDAMLKSKGYKDGSLYARIKKAEEDHLITPEMAQWAHEVRLDANFQRHADESEPLPTEEDAKKAVDFTLALGEFLFVLPSRVKRGLAEAKGESEPEKGSMKESEGPEVTEV